MKILYFLLLPFTIASCNLIKRLPDKDRKKFIYSVTQPLDESAFIVKLKIADTEVGYRYAWNRVSTLYYYSHLESGIDSIEFRKILRNDLMRDSPFNINLLGKYKFRDTLGVKLDSVKLNKVRNFINNNPDFIDTLFYERKVFNDKWQPYWLEVTWLLWDKNIGLRASLPFLGYYNNCYINERMIYDYNNDMIKNNKK